MRARFLGTLILTVLAVTSAWHFLSSSLFHSQQWRSDQSTQMSSKTSSSSETPLPLAEAQSYSGASAKESPTREEGPGDTAPASTLDASTVQHYIQAIFDPNDTTVDRMNCPATPRTRYEELKKQSDGKPRYFIALDLYEVEKLLPRLMGSIVEAVQFLGPENCAISVVEGRSDDATYEVLRQVQSRLESQNTKVYLSQDNVNPHGEGVDRIEALARLRNLAIAPIVKNPTDFSSSAIVVFINDVALCPEDILELLYQHSYQSAAMTCSMDWIHDGEAFYDIWISRTINSGNLFFDVPQDADWKYKDKLFWDDPPTREKFLDLQPFEVYACWGGMVTLDPSPFISGKLSFRKSEDDECYMGEPTLLGKDLWRLGIGHIATVPTVNVGYTNEEAAKIKGRRGYVSDHIDVSRPPSEPQAEKIAWVSKPPPMVKCINVMWDAPYWVAPV